MSNRLPVLQGQIADLHQEVLRHTIAAGEKALTAGGALNEAKALCKHGEWGAFLKATGIPERSAQRYMKLHRFGFTSAMVADFGLAQAERIASVAEKIWPDPARGRVFSGRLGKETFWGVTFRPDEAEYAFYAYVHFSNVDASHPIGLMGRAMAMPKPVNRLGLAVGHIIEMGAVPIDVAHDIPQGDAAGWFGTVGARLVNSGSGLHLEGEA